MTKHSGGCHCGAVEMKADSDPMLVIQCNCGRCRKLMGAMNVGASFMEDNVEIIGQTTSYEFTGGSGMNVQTYFCATCGCRVYTKGDAFPGMTGVYLGVFDDPHVFEPAGEIFTKYKLKWLKDDGCIKESFEEAAVEERLMALLENLEQH